MNVLVTAALAIAMLIGTSATAEKPAIIKINKGDAAQTIDIRMANLQQQITFVVLQDLEGKCWYSERIMNEDGYFKRLNLTGMPNGHYLCYVKNRSTFRTQSFYLDKSDLVLYEPSKITNPGTAFSVQTGSKRPVIMRISGQETGSIRLQLANLQEQPTHIRLNILGDGSAYEKKVSGEQALAENIRLNGMPAGAYFLYLKVGDASVIQFLEFSADGVQLGGLERLDRTPVKSAGLAQN